MGPVYPSYSLPSNEVKLEGPLYLSRRKSPMSAPAGQYNLVADQGSTLTRIIYYKDPAKKPIKFTGYKARMQVRPTVASSTVLLELTTENGGIELGDTDGSIYLYVDDTITAQLNEGLYKYDLELIAPSEDLYVYKLLQGNFAVRSEVTY